MSQRPNKEIPKNFFSPEPGDLVIHAPGRINLIGEHLDYNGGHVLPAAIDHQLELIFRRNNTSSCRVYSESFDNYTEISLDDLSPVNTGWENYIIGILAQIKKEVSSELRGFDCFIRGALPVGAGLSSSAALLCGLAKGINFLFNLGINDKSVILMAQKAEQEYAGTQCGVMDQFAVVKGETDGLIHLDCKTLDCEIIKAQFKPYRFLLLNTNVTHKLSDSEYNKRRQECEEALKIINSAGNNFSYLSDITLDTLLNLKSIIPPELLKRARYVIEENQRVLQAVMALKEGDLITLGDLMYASHSGLRDQYKVSCAELDLLVAHAQKNPKVLGARMMGGGFGGCTINLVHQDHMDEFIRNISQSYQETFNRSLTPIAVSISPGIRCVAVKDRS
ncbi:galactokinase [Zeaxanthinibacter enoshimensis]|uniref:galactokinase n=1 Tax=Zeaxanthinibacter enoshimensis TaxID=392009 RepID=UPI00356505EF